MTLRGPATTVWGFLVAATVLSWWLGTDHGLDDRDLASSLILVVAFLKARFVGRYFMDLRDAPLRLRMLFDGWCIVTCAALITLLLTA